MIAKPLTRGAPSSQIRTWIIRLCCLAGSSLTILFAAAEEVARQEQSPEKKENAVFRGTSIIPDHDHRALSVFSLVTGELNANPWHGEEKPVSKRLGNVFKTIGKGQNVLFRDHSFLHRGRKFSLVFSRDPRYISGQSEKACGN